MEQRNNNQNSVIFQIEELLNKMSKQISFLIRNDEAMTQLDLDLMMKNTRKLYDTLCSYISQQDNETTSLQEEDEDDSATQRLSDSATPGISLQDYESTSQQVEDEDAETQRLSDSETPEISLQDYESTSQQVEDDDLLTQRLGVLETEEEDDHVDMVWDFTIEDAEEDISLQDYESTSQQVEDDDLLTQRLRDSETEDDDLVTQRLRDSETEDDDLVTQRLGDSVTEEDSGIRAYKRVNNESQTLGDVLERGEDNSLAARLQRTAVTDLMSAIGINDKFLLLNELFGGSMEKYNKSIRALNNFSTLLGAKTYMSELQIEFQWDCESDAYRKLNDLIERRFISIHNS